MVTENSVIQNIDKEILEIEERYERIMEQEIRTLLLSFSKTIKNEKILKLLFEYILKDDPHLTLFEVFFMKLHSYKNIKKVSRSQYIQEAESIIEFIEAEHEEYNKLKTSDMSAESLKESFAANFCQNICDEETFEKIKREFERIKAIQEPKNIEHLTLFDQVYDSCTLKLKEFYFFFLRSDELFQFKITDIKNGFAEYMAFEKPKIWVTGETVGNFSDAN